MEKKKIEIEKKELSTIKHIILVASGKGGVGKSTVAATLALSLAKDGSKVGLLDADLYGPSVPLLFNLEDEQLRVEHKGEKDYFIPFIKSGIKLMSIGFLINTKQPIVWRGPRASSAISQMLVDTNWGELDYLIIDTPPGTSDIHITLLQNFVTAGVVIVTTPQLMALSDVQKAIAMYKDNLIGTKVLGIIENMAWFSPSKHPEEKYFLFGKGGGQYLADKFLIPLIAQLPINETICTACDKGEINELMQDVFFENYTKELCVNLKKQLELNIA
ncbi:MAG: Mrp/NBP35 family ATP-binding protein [Paludibacteraceae bacterium]|nr:Mrp/NBP35 family ATP-binding protein [Paludibacteraceae bacterium]